MPPTARSASRDKVRAHRARLRKAGLRPVQIWVPDVRSKSFAQAAHRQSLAVPGGNGSGARLTTRAPRSPQASQPAVDLVPTDEPVVHSSTVEPQGQILVGDTHHNGTD